MPYNEELDARIKKMVSRWKNTTDKKMFGGVCHLINGNMFCGVHKDSLKPCRPNKFWRNPMKYIVILITSLLIISTAVWAGEADVIEVDVKKTGGDTYFFKVTVGHEDEGWDHYANKWEVVAPDGTVLGTRTLYHPHVDEQPFTRSLSDVKIPGSITEVTVRAHDSVHEYGGKSIIVELPGK